MKAAKWVKYFIAEAFLFIKAINPPIDGYLTQYDVEMAFKKAGLERRNIRLKDTKYKTTKVSAVQRLSDFSVARFRKYRADYYDCEDFAAIFRGQVKLMCPGLIMGECDVVRSRQKDLHCINVFLTKDKRLWFVEPQSGNIFNLNSAVRKGYKVVYAYI